MIKALTKKNFFAISRFFLQIQKLSYLLSYETETSLKFHAQKIPQKQKQNQTPNRKRSITPLHETVSDLVLVITVPFPCIARNITELSE